MARNQEFAAKVSEALNTAAQCLAVETVDNYSLLRAQLQELDSLMGRWGNPSNLTQGTSR